MSMIHCDSCETYIDSDNDPDCFLEVPWLNLADRVWCESCREREWHEHERKESLVGALAEARMVFQQRAILNILANNNEGN